MPSSEKTRGILHDVLLSLLIGLAAALIVGALGALLGIFIFDAAEIPLPYLQGAVSSLLIAGSLSMLLAAFFFAKREYKKKTTLGKQWKERFRFFHYRSVFLIVSLVILGMGCLLDFLRFSAI